MASSNMRARLNSRRWLLAASAASAAGPLLSCSSRGRDRSPMRARSGARLAPRPPLGSSLSARCAGRGIASSARRERSQSRRFATASPGPSGVSAGTAGRGRAKSSRRLRSRARAGWRVLSPSGPCCRPGAPMAIVARSSALGFCLKNSLAARMKTGLHTRSTAASIWFSLMSLRQCARYVFSFSALLRKRGSRTTSFRNRK
mmetsp:Transcript_58247/g.182829  ORF Transcript_58247/g.182829 Transcript_58247/m.182829 type:complete len:202 (+) Transcript_58247:845-1450(+)